MNPSTTKTLARQGQQQMETAEAVGVELVNPSTSILGAEVDIQVATAHRYPRNMKQALAKMKDTVALSEDIAASCIYTYSRGGKDISGPSVRLAEIVASEWGNIRAKTGATEESATHVTVTGLCWDLEKNVAIQMESRRSITGNSGRYTPDMIAVTANAAGSIALRNAIFRVVPRAIVDDVYAVARQVATGDAKTIGARRTKALEWYAKTGIDAARVMYRLGVESEDQITSDHLEILLGLSSRIKDRDLDLDSEFPIPPKAKPADVPRPAPETAQEPRLAPKGSAPTPSAPAPRVEPPAKPDVPEALGPDGAAEEHRVKQIAHSLGLRPQDFAGLRAGVGLGKDPGEWTARKVAELEAAVRDHAAGAAK